MVASCMQVKLLFIERERCRREAPGEELADLFAESMDIPLGHHNCGVS
jgi:hypothetical protein